MIQLNIAVIENCEGGGKALEILEKGNYGQILDQL